MTHMDLEAAFRAGFQAGFDVSREGFNGGCFYEHCAPSEFMGDDPLQRAGDAAWRTFSEQDADGAVTKDETPQP